MSENSGVIRDEQGRFPPGISGNLQGRRPETEEEKVKKKAVKEVISEYKEKLADILPQLSPILIKKAMEGDMSAIKEIHDRVMGKSPQDLNLGNKEDLPFILKIVQKNGTTGENS